MMMSFFCHLLAQVKNLFRLWQWKVNQAPIVGASRLSWLQNFTSQARGSVLYMCRLISFWSTIFIREVAFPNLALLRHWLPKQAGAKWRQKMSLIYKFAGPISWLGLCKNETPLKVLDSPDFLSMFKSDSCGIDWRQTQRQQRRMLDTGKNRINTRLQ